MPADRHKQTQTLPCRLSQTPDHPTQRVLHQPQTCMHVKVSSAQTPLHSPAVPLAQARAEPSLITILSVSAATQMERAWERCPGVPPPPPPPCYRSRFRSQVCCWARDGDLGVICGRSSSLNIQNEKGEGNQQGY